MNTENRYQETDLGNVSPNPRGEYTPGTEYEYLDLVTFDGGSYICIAELGTTTSISPESGKNTDFWQCMTIPGDMTPEYVAMHDRVVNLSEQVEADAEEVRVAEQNVSGMKENVTQMQEQTRQSAESAGQSKDSAAGYAASADASRQAAETSEQNINAQVAGFDAHVDEKTSESNQIIEAARIAANEAILAQQEQSVNEVARVGGTAVSEAQAAARVATEKASAASESEKNAKASETAAKLSETNATKMAEQVAADKERVTNDRAAVENAKQEMTGSVAQIEQNTQGITELKGDIDKSVNKYSVSRALQNIKKKNIGKYIFNIEQYANADKYVWVQLNCGLYNYDKNELVEFDIECDKKIEHIHIENTNGTEITNMNNIVGVTHVSYSISNISARFNLKIRVKCTKLPFRISLLDVTGSNNFYIYDFSILEGTGTTSFETVELEKFVDYNDFYGDTEKEITEYIDGMYTNKNKECSVDDNFKYTITKIPDGCTKIGIHNVVVGGNIGIWLMKNGEILDVFSKDSMELIYIELNSSDYDAIGFSTSINNISVVEFLEYSKSPIYATNDELNDYVKKELIETDYIYDNQDLTATFTNGGFTDIYGNISSDTGLAYSNWIRVVGGRNVRISSIVLTPGCVIQCRDEFNNFSYIIPEIGYHLDIIFTIPKNTIEIRYTKGIASNSNIKYVDDLKKTKINLFGGIYSFGNNPHANEPILTFVDDDGNKAYFDVIRPILNTRGVNGTVAMITSFVGNNDNYLSLEQLNILKNEGYDICSHTHTHNGALFNPNEGLPTSNEDDIYNDLVASRRWLENNGFNSEGLIFPWGSYGEHKRKAILQAIKAGFQYASDATGQINIGNVINTYWLQRWFIGSSNGHRAVDAKNRIDQCIQENGWLILSTHCYNTDEFIASEFEEVVDYAISRGINIMTYKDAFDAKRNICSIGYYYDKSNRLYIGRDGIVYND